MTRPAGTAAASVLERVDALDWTEIAAELGDLGCAQTAAVFDPKECRRLVEQYDDQDRFRSTVDMERYRFGEGQYRYFDHPLPEVVAGLRAAFWPHLLPIARAWASQLGRPAPWPDDLDTWLDPGGATRSA